MIENQNWLIDRKELLFSKYFEIENIYKPIEGN